MMDEPCYKISSYYFALQELLRNTSHDHSDYANLTKAVKYIGDMNKHLNESIANDNINNKVEHKKKRSFSLLKRTSVAKK